MIDDLTIRSIRDDEVEEANSLHNEAYGEQRTREQWDWLFRGARDEDPIFVVAVSKGRILGTQAIMPIEMAYRGQRFLTGKSEETLVDPALRGQGVFDKMYEALLPICARRDVKTIWGFTPATKAFVKVGFEVPWSTEQLFFPLAASAPGELMGEQAVGTKRRLIGAAGAAASAGSKICWHASTLARSRASDVLRFEATNREPSNCDEFAVRFADRWRMATVFRGREYMAWRIARNPFLTGRFVCAYSEDQLLGWAVYAIDERSNGFIVDLAVAGIDVHNEGPTRAETIAMDGLLSRSVGALRTAGAKSIRMWGQGAGDYQTYLRSRARRHGFWHVRRGEPSVFLRNDEDLLDYEGIREGSYSRITTMGTSG